MKAELLSLSKVIDEFNNLFFEKIDEMENELQNNFPNIIDLDFDLFMDGCT